jgi:hypothetical protein
MARKVHLNVLLPRDRNRPGWLRVEVDEVPVAEFRVLGRGSATAGNPTRNQFAYAGDTPTGMYSSPGIVSTTDWEQRSYGPWGAVRLRATQGNALLAERVGRTGLLIHGGSPGSPTVFGGYRSTLGCLRVSNEDMLRLRNLIFTAAEDAQARTSNAISINVTVQE